MCGARAEESEGPPASGKRARRRTRHEAASVCVPSLHAKELHLNGTCVCSGFPGRAWRREADADRGAYAVRAQRLLSSVLQQARPPPRPTARAAFAPVAVSTEVTQFGCANPRIRGSSAGTARNSAHSAIQPNFRSVVSISLAAARDCPSGERIKCGCALEPHRPHAALTPSRAAAAAGQRRRHTHHERGRRRRRWSGPQLGPIGGQVGGEGPLAAVGSRACAIQREGGRAREGRCRARWARGHAGETAGARPAGRRRAAAA